MDPTHASADFERSSSGLYLPAARLRHRLSVLHRAKVALGDAWLSTVINATMVLIQLLTGWILWMTYQNTVIPTRQKELLSEQLAQLELERKTVVEDIARSRRDAEVAAQSLARKQEEVRQLGAEKERLTAAVATASVAVKDSMAAAQHATALAKDANSQLGMAQMSIFEQHASLIVASPKRDFLYRSLNNLIEETNADRKDRTLPSIGQYIDSLLATWPQMGAAAEQVIQSLRAIKSDLFPPAYGEDLAAYLAQRSSTLTCAMPDRDLMVRRYEDLLRAEIAAASKRREAQRAEYVADGLKKGIRYVFDAKDTRRIAEIEASTAGYLVRGKARDEIRDQAEACFEPLEALADAYFKDRGAKVQTLPREAFK